MAIVNQLVVVPNTLAPYGYELVNLLAYPAGFIQRFRFEEEWVTAGLQATETGYIVLRDWETAKLYPIRKFKLLLKEKIGSIYYFQCELGELFEFDSDEQRRTAQLEEFNREFVGAKTEIRSSNHPREDMKPLVFITGYNPKLDNVNSTAPNDQTAKTNEKWGNLLQAIRAISFYGNIEFLRIINVTEHGWPNKIAPIDDHAYVLKRGLNYEVIIAQYRLGGINNIGVPRDIELIGDNKTVVPIRSKQRAVGKYDILSFVLSVDQNARIKRSFFDLKFTPASDLASYINPFIQVPIKLHTPISGVLVRLLFIVAFITVYFVPSLLTTFSSILSPEVFGINSTQLIRDLSLFILTVTTVDLLTELRKR